MKVKKDLLGVCREISAAAVFCFACFRNPENDPFGVDIEFTLSRARENGNNHSPLE